MRSNPNRVNLGRIGLAFFADGHEIEASEAEFKDSRQELDLWTGILRSSFSWHGNNITVETMSAQDSDTVGITVTSNLVKNGSLGLFFDFPWNDGKLKFAAPYVGAFNATEKHTTKLDQVTKGKATIEHTMDGSTFVTTLGGAIGGFNVSRKLPDAHRYTVLPSTLKDTSTFSLTATYSLQKNVITPSAQSVKASSTKAWLQYWMQSGFIDITSESTDPRAEELQRRIVLSRYLMRVNEAGDSPPQEVNNLVLTITVPS
jgi:hypothetical protein